MQEMTAVFGWRGCRRFCYVGNVRVAEKRKEASAGTVPGLQVVGAFHPPFGDLTPAEGPVVVAVANAARPDIVWAGLSAPKQERWMIQRLGRVDAPITVGVGAPFDLLARTRRRAARRMQPHALEQLFRLRSEVAASLAALRLHCAQFSHFSPLANSCAPPCPVGGPPPGRSRRRYH